MLWADAPLKTFFNEVLLPYDDFGYKNDLQDIKRITAEGIEFTNGESIDAELKIIFPDWVAHDFMHNLLICYEKGFVITNLEMRNPEYHEVFAAGDVAAATVPKLGSIGHAQSYIVAKQIAKDLGCMNSEETDKELYNQRLSVMVIWVEKKLFISIQVHGMVVRPLY